VRRLRFLLAHRLKTSLWLIPFACALAGIVLSVVTVAIDRSLQSEVVPPSITGDPNAALIILSTVAASMVSLTALVLTITSVVVQLAMGQFSPRSVRPFLQDRPSQFAIGVFVGTFAHAMFTMREVHSFTQQGSVPGVSIVVSYALVFASVVVLVAYVHHIANALKVDSIIQSVGEETRGLLDKLYDSRTPGADSEPEPRVITAERAGLIFRIDHDALVDAAERADITLNLLHGVGTFVPEGAPLFRWEGDGQSVDVDAVRRAVAMGPERTMDQDGAFGVQTLVDITERSLTDSFNDQTTAAQAIDRLHDILRSLATRRFPSGRFQGADGRDRLIVPELGWDDYVGIAFDQVSLAAAQSPAVIRRLHDAMEDLLTVTSGKRRQAIEIRLRNLRRIEAGEDIDMEAIERSHEPVKVR
jgi:uncharacterized membrane protein